MKGDAGVTGREDGWGNAPPRECALGLMKGSAVFSVTRFALGLAASGSLS